MRNNTKNVYETGQCDAIRGAEQKKSAQDLMQICNMQKENNAKQDKVMHNRNIPAKKYEAGPPKL